MMIIVILSGLRRGREGGREGERERGRGLPCTDDLRLQFATCTLEEKEATCTLEEKEATCTLEEKTCTLEEEVPEEDDLRL